MKLAREAHRARVRGFRFAGVRCGLKTRGPDVALVAADAPATIAGLFTTNRTQAAPVRIARARVAGGRARAVLVHAGNANACTGAEGLRTVARSTGLAADLLGVTPEVVVPAATGRIGTQVPRDRLERGVRRAVAALARDGFADAARAITTTDHFPKTAVRRVRLGRRTVTIAVMGKGAGMIHPDMATLLVFAMTDAPLGAAAARQALRVAVADTLNAISVDGDTSTNDTVLLLASGAAGGPVLAAGSGAHRRFTAALRDALREIAWCVVADGEGSAHVVTVEVRGAARAADAKRMANAVATSTLCKAAFHGADPNWGRFVCAAGAAGVAFDPDRVSVTVGGVRVSDRGRPRAAALGRAAARMRRREVTIILDLHAGRARASVLTSDLTLEYVHFNAAYTT